MEQTEKRTGLASSKKNISPALAAIIGFILGVVLTSLVMNWQDVKDGWQDGIEGKAPRYETKPAGQ